MALPMIEPPFIVRTLGSAAAARRNASGSGVDDVVVNHHRSRDDSPVRGRPG